MIRFSQETSKGPRSMEQSPAPELTARQAEFLEVVRDLSSGAGEGVHYSEVAQRLGVSRWTAYDILSSLVQKGYLTVEREQRSAPSLVGRCRVLFRPGPRRLSPPLDRVEDRFPELWGSWEERLFCLQREIRERGVWSVLHEVVAEMARITQPMVFCAALTLALLLALRAVVRGADGLAVWDALLSWLAGSETGLAVFAGAVGGLLLQHGLPRELRKPLLDRLPAFEQEVGLLGEEGKESLRRFTLTAIREVWGEGVSG